mgnify:FL=1
MILVLTAFTAIAGIIIPMFTKTANQVAENVSVGQDGSVAVTKARHQSGQLEVSL